MGQLLCVRAHDHAGGRAVRRIAHKHIPVREKIALPQPEHSRADLAGGFRINAGKLLLQLSLFIKLVKHQRGQRRTLIPFCPSHILHLRVSIDLMIACLRAPVKQRGGARVKNPPLVGRFFV